MAYQRVDKKKPKLVLEEDLEGFSYKSEISNETECVILDMDCDLLNIYSVEGGNFGVFTDDVPNLVKALWAAYALAEQRKMQENF